MKKAIATILNLISMGASSEMQSTAQGYWSIGTSKTWSKTDLDIAFAVLISLKDKHGEQLNFIVQDLHKEGTPTKDGEKNRSSFNKNLRLPTKQ